MAAIEKTRPPIPLPRPRRCSATVASQDFETMLEEQQLPTDEALAIEYIGSRQLLLRVAATILKLPTPRTW